MIILTKYTFPITSSQTLPWKCIPSVSDRQTKSNLKVETDRHNNLQHIQQTATTHWVQLLIHTGINGSVLFSGHHLFFLSAINYFNWLSLTIQTCNNHSVEVFFHIYTYISHISIPDTYRTMLTVDVNCVNRQCLIDPQTCTTNLIGGVLEATLSFIVPPLVFHLV